MPDISEFEMLVLVTDDCKDVVVLELACEVADDPLELPPLYDPLVMEEDVCTTGELEETDVLLPKGLRVPVKMSLKPFELKGFRDPVSIALTPPKPLESTFVPDRPFVSLLVVSVAKGLFAPVSIFVALVHLIALAHQR